MLFCDRFQRHYEAGTLETISPASKSQASHPRGSQASAVPTVGGQCRACPGNPNKTL